MEELLNHVDVIVVLVAAIAGYVDLRSIVKSNKERHDKTDERIETILTKLEKNEREDAVRDEKLNELKAYKDVSSQSKDEALQKLGKIETLLEQLMKQNDERHKEYAARFERLEQKIIN